MISMDWEPCSYCLQNKRTSELSVSSDHLRHQGCTDFTQISHPFAHSCLSCNRNVKCKPWRRKILTNRCSKWTYLLSAVPFMTLLSLLTNLSQQVFQILSRTIFARKNSRLIFHWGLLFIALFGGISSLPLALCQENLQPTPSVKSLQLPNMVVHVGSSFIYNISEKAFDCEVDDFVVSETADRFLSHWLAYNSNKKQLYGVPSEKDQGTYNILVVALAKDGGVGGHVCGSRSFFISVVPVSEELPVSVYRGTESSSSDLKSVQSLPCVPGTQVLQGTLILNADMHSLNGHERMTWLLKIADHLKVHTSKVSFFSGQASHPIIGQLDDAAVMAAGAGDGRFTKGSRSLLTWHIGCGAIKLEDLAFSKLETSTQDGTISSLLGVPVVGWHIMFGTQRNMARRRVRRQVLGVTATPLASSAPPSRMSNISTSFIVSSTVTLTSMVSSNSTMQLSTTAASSVGPNTTVSSVSFSSISVNSTVSSLSSSRTDIQSSSIVNLTSSATVFLPSSVTKSLAVNSSMVVLSRNVSASVESSTLVSSINRTSLIMQSSVLSPTLNSTFVTKTVTTNLSSSVTPSSSLLTTIAIRNSSSIVVSLNETTAFVSSSSTVLSVNSTRLLSSFTVTSSLLNLTLTTSMSRVSSSVIIRTSSLAVSSSRPTLVPSSNSTSLLTSSSSVFSPSSLVVLLNTTAVVNASTAQLNSTTALNQTSVTPMLTASSTVVPTLSSIIPTLSTVVLSLNSTIPISSTVVPTLSSIERSVIKTSSLVPPILNSSSIMLSSSLILPSSTSSSMRINMTSVIRNTSASLQTNVTSTTVVLSSLTSSPLATTANLTSTSVVISLNASTTKRTALVNSTSIIDRSSFVTSAFSPTGTSESRTFPSSFATNRTVIATTSVGVDKSSVNITATPVLGTKSLRTAPVTSVLPSFTFSTEFRSVIASNSSFVTPSSTSSEVRLNSTAVSRTQEFSTLSTIVSTKLVSVNSTFLLPGSSKLFPNSSLLVTSILSTSKPIFVSSTTSLPNTSSVFNASKTSVSDSTFVTLVESSVLKSSSLMSSSDVVSSSSVFTKRSSVLNATSRLTTAIFSSSGSVMASSARVSLTRSSPAFNSSLFTSSVISQTLVTSFATSRTLKSSTSVQNSTAVLRTSGDISSSFSTLVSSFSLVQRSSTVEFNSSTTELPTSATETPTLTEGILTSSRIRNATMLSSPSSSVTPVFTRSTLQTDLGTSKSTRTVVRSTVTPHSSSRFVSSGIPSSAQPSTTVTPVNSTVASSMETSGTLSSFSSALPSSNTTQTVTPTDSTVTFSVTPSSTVIVPTTAPPNNPPRLYNNMGRVSAPAGKALYFTIPDDTFYDSEDQATTRNLSLSVSLANGTSIPSDFWLQFDNTSQVIYGLPLSAHVPSGVIGEGFILRARDSRGAEALDAFEVLVVPSEKSVVQELRIRITNDFRAFNRNVSQRLLLLGKIAAYYNDTDRSRIRVLNFISGSVIMTWTNDSLPTDRCDEERLNYVANKVLLPDGQVREEFQNALQGFPVESASQQRMGVCNETDPGEDTPIAPAAQSKQEEDLWYKHVLVGVFVVFIVIVLAVLLIWYCRRRRPKPSSEKRTFKKRKPIVLEPEIELKPIPGQPLFLPHDDPSLPPSYISETSLDKPVYSDDEDEVDYGKRSPSVVYEPPPPFHAALADDPRNSPPPAYLMPPMY